MKINWRQTMKINARCAWVLTLIVSLSLIMTRISSGLTLHAQALANIDAIEGEDEQILTIDRFVPHISTVPANAGKQVGLFVRERVRRGDYDEQDQKYHRHGRPVVL